jgi:hypothetical protein
MTTKDELGLMFTDITRKVRLCGHTVTVTTEYQFHPERKWRFDWAIPELFFAVEYEGIFSTHSRHTSLTGFTGDCEKYSVASIMGWMFVRITAPMMRSQVKKHRNAAPTVHPPLARQLITTGIQNALRRLKLDNHKG